MTRIIMVMIAWLSVYGAASKTPPPADEAQLLSTTLVNRDTTRTNSITLEQLLTMKQTVMGQTAAFDAPIAYDALRTHARPVLTPGPGL